MAGRAEDVPAAAALEMVAEAATEGMGGRVEEVATSAMEMRAEVAAARGRRR
jgi:hypothetical protein